MIDGSRITLALAIDPPRPHRRDPVDLALLEERILKDLIHEDVPAPDHKI